MRIERPSPRAASGSFFAPKSSTTTAKKISKCQGLNPPIGGTFRFFRFSQHNRTPPPPYRRTAVRWTPPLLEWVPLKMIQEYGDGVTQVNWRQ